MTNEQLNECVHIIVRHWAMIDMAMKFQTRIEIAGIDRPDDEMLNYANERIKFYQDNHDAILERLAMEKVAEIQQRQQEHTHATETPTK